MNLSVRHAVQFLPEVTHLDGQGVGPGLPPLDLLGACEPGWGQDPGIKALMLAVLEEGIRDYLGARAPLRNEAAYWIASATRRSPFAFCTVCEILGLEPTAVRVALQRLREKNISAREALGRSRPNVRHPGPVLARSTGRKRNSITKVERRQVGERGGVSRAGAAGALPAQA